MDKLPITALVVTYNDDRRLNECLESLKFCDQVLVFDMGSTDGSVQIAELHADKVKGIPRKEVVEEIYSKIVKESMNDWIILHDPDEVFPIQLLKSIQADISSKDNLALLSIPIQYYFLGKPLTTTFWGQQNYKTKFFNRQRIIIGENVHNSINPKIGFIVQKYTWDPSICIKHYWVDSINHLLIKHWRYIKAEGKSKFQNGERFHLRKLTINPFKQLYLNLIRYKGLWGGLSGIFLSFFYSCYTFLSEISLLIYQIRKNF